MTSTIDKPSTYSDNNEYGTEWSQIAQLDAMLESPQAREADTPQTIDTYEESTSPRERASSRIGNWLRRLAERVDSTSERIAEEKDIIRENLISFGHAAQRIAEKTRNTVVDAGTAALHGAKEVGLTTVGLGVMGAESAATAITDQYTKGEEFGYQATTAALEFGRDKVGQAREWLQQKRDAALARKTARRAKWLARFNAVKNATTEIVDTTKDTLIGAAETVVDAGRSTIDRTKDTVTSAVERTRETVHVARAVGAAAIEGARQASSAAYAAHSEQNKL